MAVGRELYRKYLRMFCIHFFLAVSVHLVCVIDVCRKNRLNLKTHENEMENGMVEGNKGGLFHFTHKDGHLHNPFGQLWKYIGFQFIIHSLLYIKV